MSVEEEVSALIDGVTSATETSSQQNRDQTLKEVAELLKATNDSLFNICREAELASSKEAFRVAFKRFNRVMRFFLEGAPGAESAVRALKAISTLPMSGRFESILTTAGSVQEAATSYKEALCRGLASKLRREDERERLEDSKDDELFSRFLPEVPPVAQISDVTAVDPASSRSLFQVTTSRKRDASAVTDVVRIPKKSKIPALASLSRVSGLSNDGSPKKRVLVTREKLRAGLHDPRGLLDLEGSSTSALERTKKLELLKSAGCLFEKKKKDQSFADKLNAAVLRLELGVGGHSVADSILFGAKVLSIPGFLSPKNLSDIENNIVDGNTT